jgi:peptide/nickel transport system ATP-binding protein
MTAGLQVRGLTLDFATEGGPLHVLRGIDLDIRPGEVLGLVGESGSGKSTIAYAVVRYLLGGHVTSGRIVLDDRDVLDLGAEALRALRGSDVAMVYQDPSTALNPTLRLGEQLEESVGRDATATTVATAERARDLLTQVGLPDPAFIMRRFPHEVSGGEKQRVLLAMALAGRPKLLIFDEPTTALDATTAAGILDLIRGLQSEIDAAILFISHDLGTIARVAQRVAVIYAGRIVERGPVASVLHRPRHPYTRMLMASVPNPYRSGPRRRLISFVGAAPDLRSVPAGCVFAGRCPFAADECRRGVMALTEETHAAACVRLSETADRPLPGAPAPGETARVNGADGLLRVSHLTVEYGHRGFVDQLLNRKGDRVSAVADVTFHLDAGETVGLVGESGCGKSTLARALVGLVPFAGEIELDGRSVVSTAAMDFEYRRAVQIVFQHPDTSLNPRMSVGAIVGRPLRLYERLSGKALDFAVAEWLDRVRLPTDYANRYPHALSGGEKQRVAVARAFAARPRLVICDEISSSLDVSVQASILNLLADLQDNFGTAYLFITHDLNLVRHIADRILVMYLGRLVEVRRAGGDLVVPPFHPYTEALLSAVPVPEPSLEARRVRLSGPLPSPKNPPSGCRFNSRCPRKIGALCEREAPPVLEVDADHRIECHIGLSELASLPPIWRASGAASPSVEAKESRP